MQICKDSTASISEAVSLSLPVGRRARVIEIVHELDRLRNQVAEVDGQIARREAELDALIGVNPSEAASELIPSGVPQQAYDLLVAAGGAALMAAEIAAKVGANVAVHSALSRLAASGLVEKAGEKGGCLVPKPPEVNNEG